MHLPGVGQLLDVRVRNARFLTRKKIEFTDKDVQDNLEYIKVAIKAEIFGYHYGLEERQKVLSERDAQIQKALELFPLATDVSVTAEKAAPEADAAAGPKKN